jgi:uncharacterized protein (DUF58 family)
VNLRPTHRIGGYGFLVIVGLAAALVLGRPEPAVLVAPFAVFLAIGLALGPPPPIDLRYALERDRVVEDDTVEFTLHCRTPGLEVTPLLPSAVAVVDDDHTASTRTLVLRPTRWGLFAVGTVLARVSDPLRLWVRESMLLSPTALRVHPRIERLRRVFPPAELQPFVGQHASRARGDGFELAEVRPYAVGDRAGAVNWRATARRGSLWVNDRHPERTGDVVLLHDTFGTAEDDRVALLDAGVHTLSALARAYERTHDRVGLVTFGGHLRWLRAGAGRRNLVRIIDGMLDTERLLTDAWEDVLRVPVGAIPPRSLLVAVTSLDHDTALNALIDLRARGFDLAVLTLPVPPVGDERVRRLDALLRDARRRRLERFGVAVADLGDGVDAAIEEVSAWRRRLARSSR